MIKKINLITPLLAVFILAACGSGTTGTKDENKTSMDPNMKMDSPKKEDNYKKYQMEIQKVTTNTEKYKDIQVAINDGFRPDGPYVPGMGYHFVNMNMPSDDPANPNTLLYVLDKDGNFILGGVAWHKMGEKPTKQLFNGIDWAQSSPAGAKYDDGSFIPVEKKEGAPAINPKTKAKFVEWMPNAWTVHMYTNIKNPNGAFSGMNTVLMKYDSYAKPEPPIDKYLKK